MMDRLLEILSGPGLFGTRAPLFPDLVVLALVLVVPLLATGVALARAGRRRAHAHVMGWTYTVLAIVVSAFIWWNDRGGPPPSAALEQAWFYKSHYIPFITGHIFVALAGLLAGALAVTHGLARARTRERALVFPSAGSARLHRVLGRTAVMLLLLTSLSGCGIYYLRYLYGG